MTAELHLPPTPYAALMVRPADSDETIRAQFHALSKEQHPDRAGADGVPGKEWYDIVAAYTAIKTLAAREALARRMAALSGFCTACTGSGVRGSRFAGSRLRHCDACHGAGRTR